MCSDMHPTFEMNKHMNGRCDVEISFKEAAQYETCCSSVGSCRG